MLRGQQLLRRDRPKGGQIRGPELGPDGGAGLQCLVQRPEAVIGGLGGDAAGFGDGPGEEPPAQRRDAEGVDAGGPGGLSGKGDPGRVAAEGRDIVPDPFQGPDLVQQTVVARGPVGGLGSQGLVGQETEDTQAVGAVDHHDPLPGQGLAVVLAVGWLAGGHGAAVDVEQDRQAGGISGRLPDIEIEGVLAHGLDPVVCQAELVSVIAEDLHQGVHHRMVPGLHGHGGKGVADPDALPGLRGLGFLPAQLPHRGLGIGDARVDLHGPVGGTDAGEPALRHRNDVSHGRFVPGHGGDPALRGSGELEEQADQHQGSHEEPQPGQEARPRQELHPQQGPADQQDQQQGPAPEGVFAQLKEGEGNQGDQNKKNPEQHGFSLLSLFHLVSSRFRRSIL